MSDRAAADGLTRTQHVRAAPDSHAGDGEGLADVTPSGWPGAALPGRDVPLTVSAHCLRHADFPTRVTAAAGAGFTGIGLRLSDYEQARSAGLADAQLRDLLSAHGLHVHEVEHTWDWVASNRAVHPTPDPAEARLFAMVRALGCRQINLYLFEQHPRGLVVDAFGRFSDRAAAYGLRVGLEFIPYSTIATLSAAQEIVEGADRPNAGIVIDAWHWFRSGAQLGELVDLPPRRLISCQLNDVLPIAGHDLAEEARHHRQLPGAGCGDLGGLLSVLKDKDPTLPLSVEVFSDWLDRHPAGRAARLVFDSAQLVLAESDWRADHRTP
jgi:sugar phosphate isomerase/epimerase